MMLLNLLPDFHEIMHEQRDTMEVEGEKPRLIESRLLRYCGKATFCLSVPREFGGWAFVTVRGGPKFITPFYHRDRVKGSGEDIDN